MSRSGARGARGRGAARGGRAARAARRGRGRGDVTGGGRRRGRARQDHHRAARPRQDQLPDLPHAVLVPRGAALPVGLRARGGRGRAVARQQRHHGAHRALRRHTVHGARAVEARARGRHAAEGQTEQADAPGGGVAGGRDVAERDVPAGPGARAHGRHVARAVLVAARRLRARRRRRGVHDALQGLRRDGAGRGPVRRRLLLHVRYAQTQIPREVRQAAERVDERGVRRRGRRARPDRQLPARHRAAPHADRAARPVHHHRRHARYCVPRGGLARLLQGAEHELGEGAGGGGHLVRHVRRHQGRAQGPRAHAADTVTPDLAAELQLTLDRKETILLKSRAGYQEGEKKKVVEKGTMMPKS